MIFKYFICLIICSALFACNSAEKAAEQKAKDSVENVELKTVDEMIKNEDSIVKAKEAELLKQYGN